MKKLNPVLGSLVFGCFTLVSCKQEAEPQTEKEPLTLQDIAVDPAFEEAAAKQSETISNAKKMKDEINAEIKASEENAENLKKILEGR